MEFVCIQKLTRFLILAGLGILLGACSSTASPSLTATSTTVVSPTPSFVLPTLTPLPPTASTTFTLSPSSTKTISVTSTPSSVTKIFTITPTSWPTLSPDGPYLLVYMGLVGERETIHILEPEGPGRKVIQLPKNSVLYNASFFDDLVSPDGKWLAFHVRTNDRIDLNLLHLPDGNVRHVAEVMPSNFQIGQDFIATALPTILPTEMIPEEGFAYLDQGYMEGINSVSWSPDGRYLAFAGQIDGPSSDLYLYALQTNTTQRLSDDLLNIQNIYWSPNGDWVIYTNNIPGYDYSGASLSAVQPEGTLIADRKPLYMGYFWMGWDWLSHNLLVITRTYDGGSGNLRYLNIETGAIAVLWPHGYESYALDPHTQHIYVSRFDDEEGIGTYEVSMDGNFNEISTEVFDWMIYRGNKTHLLVGSDISYSKAIALTQNGEIVSLIERSEPEISISPDHRWMVVYNGYGIDLLDENDHLIRTIDYPGVYGTSLMWRPDSAGFYFASDSSVVYMDVPEGEPMMVDTCPNGDCYLYHHKFVWLP